MIPPDYLGDAVYVHVTDDDSLVLTTGHHEPSQADNVIYMDENVVAALLRYLDRVAAAKALREEGR